MHNKKPTQKSSTVDLFILNPILIILLLVSIGTFIALKSDNLLKAVLSSTTGAELYVDGSNYGGAGCSDTWPGTISQPLCTPAKAVSLASPGHTIYFRKGSYNSFLINKSGAVNNHITFMPYQNEAVVINGAYDGISIKNASYITVNGFEIKGASGSYGAGIHITPGSVGSNNNIIENNIVHDNLGTNTLGIFIENSSNNKIAGNKVFNNFLSGISIISHATTSPNGITGNLILGNTVYGNKAGAGNSDGIQLSGTGTKQTSLIGNITYDNGDDGIDTWNTSQNVLTNNISYNNKGAGDGNGFKLGGSTTGGNNRVQNNISYGNKNNGFDSNGSGGNTYYHNVAYNNGKYGFEDGWKDATCTVSTCKTTLINNIGYNNIKSNLSAGNFTAISRNNIWYTSMVNNAQVSYSYVIYNDLISFYTASGNKLDNPNNNEYSSLQVNPQFVSAAGGDFKLNSSSPAIDAGDPTNPGGNTVIGDPDIGAHEYTYGTSPTLTPTPTPIPSVTLSPTPAPAVNTVVKFTSSASTGIESLSLVNVEVSMDRTSTNNVSVTYQVQNGTASFGTDYLVNNSTSSTGTVVIPAGQVKGTIALNIVNDTIKEKGKKETIILKLTNVTFGTLGTTTQYTYSITDDD